jgi:polyisoprenoid-binding protein YceI
MTSSPTPSRSRRGPILALGLIGVLVLAAAGAWYLFLRPSGPAAVSLESLPPVAAASAPASGSLATPGSEPVSPGTSPGSPASATPAAGDGIAGTWTVDPTIGTVADGTGSFVGYRVQEQLANVGAVEAVGRTPDVAGTMTIDGTTITTAEVTADLTTLRSDEGNRDRQLSRQALETGQFPTATFVLAEPIELGELPAEGEIVEATAIGDLTLHGVTNRVEVPLEARLQGGVVTVAGSLPIAFADWAIEQPRAMIVLSVDDHGTMELQLHFTRA